MCKLNKKICIIWVVLGVILFLLLVAPFVAILFAVEPQYMVMTLVIGLPIELILASLLILIPILRYKFYRYSFDAKHIVIKKGILFHQEIIIPVCQIQDLHIYQGPLMQMAKLGGVIISTAGSNYTIAGMTMEDAREMVDKLEDYLQARIEEIRNETLH